jgi:hypothetical protein
VEGGLPELDKIIRVDSSGVHEEPKVTQGKSPKEDYAQNEEDKQEKSPKVTQDKSPNEDYAQNEEDKQEKSPKVTQDQSPNEDYAQNEEDAQEKSIKISKLQTDLSLESQNGGIRNSEVGERLISEKIHTNQASHFLTFSKLFLNKGFTPIHPSIHPSIHPFISPLTSPTKKSSYAISYLFFSSFLEPCKTSFIKIKK